MSEFPQRLRAAREKAGYSQYDLAQLIPCPQTRIAMWEMDTRNINHKDLARCCRVLNVSADYLLGLEKGE
jgi:transcriptional regulator with XRE-family HTH domain